MDFNLTESGKITDMISDSIFQPPFNKLQSFGVASIKKIHKYVKKLLI